MPYARKYRRYARKGKRVYRKARRYAGYAATAYRAYRLASSVASMVNAETKKQDTDIAFPTTETGSILNLVGIAQGDDDNQRNGNSIKLKRITIKGTIAHDNGTSVKPGVVKLWIIRDKQQQADTSPTYTEVFDENSIHPFLNPDNVGRFQILASRTINLSDTSILKKTFSVSVPFKNLHVRYNGSATSDIQRNGIYMLYISSNNSAGGSGPYFQGQSRVYYYDN